MIETVKRIACMVLYGASSISMTEKRNYFRHVPMNASREAAVRWFHIGLRMRDSMNKVVGEVAEA